KKRTMIELLIDVSGWAGAIILIAAYGLTSFDYLKADSAAYQWLNILGSILLIVNTAYYEVLPSTLLNSVWCLFGLVAILVSARKLRLQKRSPQVSVS
ncbi:MAG: hypothetical protein AAFV80_17330, partial [Bacteroidota bacterium]